jgi:hypothetical protein
MQEQQRADMATGVSCPIFFLPVCSLCEVTCTARIAPHRTLLSLDSRCISSSMSSSSWHGFRRSAHDVSLLTLIVAAHVSQLCALNCTYAGLFHAATDGPAPSAFDPSRYSAREQWEAHAAVGRMAKPDAMRAYCALLVEAIPEYVVAHSRCRLLSEWRRLLVACCTSAPCR